MQGRSRTIAITGAGDGLGRALARRFAGDGERVILLGRTLSKLDRLMGELGESHAAFECDVADPDSVRRAFGAIAEQYERIDVLINNAAIYEPFTLAEASDSQIAEHLAVNLAGPIHCARAALPLFGGKGHIINVTSEAVPLKMPMLWMYGATKAALAFISDMWSRELEAEGVRVTVVQAGQMMDETKAPPAWPREVALRFAEENARIGLNLRERPISHYRSVTDLFRAVLDAPADLHIASIALSAARPNINPEEAQQ